MPRQARKKSQTGTYHVMLRAINGQKIFFDNEDYERLIDTLGRYKEVCKYDIYAYCLMSNHVHILIKEGKEDLGKIFRRVGPSFVYWYNEKYKRTGHLFQDRYKSEPVEDNRYFITVLRYIHQNPVKAGIVKNIEEYPWSSFKEYLGNNGMCDTELALSLFSESRKEGIAVFKDFNMQKNDDKCLEYDKQLRINDQEAVKIIKDLVCVEDPEEISMYEKKERDGVIKQLREKGLSIRQLERLTGISFAIIRRC